MSRRTAPSKNAPRKSASSAAPRAAASRATVQRAPQPLFPERTPLPLYVWPVMMLIIGYGLWLQTPGLHNEILERLHGWRECQTAMTSRNFVKDGMNPLVARVDYIGNGQMQLELPIYQYLVSICYVLFGMHEIWGRIVAMVFGVGSAVVLLLLGRMVWTTTAGLIAAAVFSWSPLDVYFNRAFMPDSSTICFTLLALWMFLRYFRDSRPRDLWIACAAIAFALAGKPPIAVTVAPPLAVALFMSRGWRVYQDRRLLIGLIAALAFFLGWFKYSYNINNYKSDNLREAGLSFTNAGEDNKDLMKWYFGSAEQRRDPKTYVRMFSRVPDWIGHWAPSLAYTRGASGVLEFICHYGAIGVALLGICLSWRYRMQWILAAWFGGCLVYMLLFLNVNFIHDYYQMPVVPMLALAAAVGVSEVARLLTPRKSAAATAETGGSKLKLSPGWIVGMTLILAFTGAQAYAGYAVLRDYDAFGERWAPGQRTNWSVISHYAAMGKTIQTHLPDEPGVLVLAGASFISDCRDPQLIYKLNRRAFVVQASDEKMTSIKAELTQRVRSGQLAPMMFDSESRRLRCAWVAQRFDKILELAMQKGARILVLTYPSVLLPPDKIAALEHHHKLHYRDPGGQFEVYILKPAAISSIGPAS